jgi:hypothetical protein
MNRQNSWWGGGSQEKTAFHTKLHRIFQIAEENILFSLRPPSGLEWWGELEKEEGK